MERLYSGGRLSEWGLEMGAGGGGSFFLGGRGIIEMVFNFHKRTLIALYRYIVFFNIKNSIWRLARLDILAFQVPVLSPLGSKNMEIFSFNNRHKWLPTENWLLESFLAIYRRMDKCTLQSCYKSYINVIFSGRPWSHALGSPYSNTEITGTWG